MSAKNGENPPLRNQPPMPEYFQRDQVGRNEFLSQIGQFSEDHRSLFNRLCDMWEPSLPYKRFLDMVDSDYIDAEVKLAKLMAALERGNCGLILNTIQNKKIEKDQIILTDRDDPRFWYWVLENEWQICQLMDNKNFPITDDYSDRSGFPLDSIESLSLENISSLFLEQHQDDIILYTLSDFKKKILLTPRTIPMMLQASRLKIRLAVFDNPLGSILARLMGTVLSNLLKSLKSDGSIFWNNLTKTMTEQRKELLAKNNNLSEKIFRAAHIIEKFTSNEINQMQKNQEEEAEKREKIKAILGKIAQTKGFLMSSKQFEKEFDPYTDKWPDLKIKFAEHCMHNPSRNGLPIVINLNENYLYRDHLYPLFKMEHKTASLALRRLYLDKFERILKSRKTRVTFFASSDLFIDDIRQHLKKDFPTMLDLLNKPKLVSEGIIHYMRKVSKITDMERVRKLLEYFFEGSPMRFKSLDEFFKLYAKEIFEKSFQELNWIRRFFIKIFGRYDSYLQHIESGRTNKRAATKKSSLSSSPREQSSQNENPEIPLSQTEENKSKSRQKPSSRNAKKMTASLDRRKKNKEKKLKKQNLHYSSRQQEEAWKDFKNISQKKKR